MKLKNVYILSALLCTLMQVSTADAMWSSLRNWGSSLWGSMPQSVHTGAEYVARACDVAMNPQVYAMDAYKVSQAYWQRIRTGTQPQVVVPQVPQADQQVGHAPQLGFVPQAAPQPGQAQVVHPIPNPNTFAAALGYYTGKGVTDGLSQKLIPATAPARVDAALTNFEQTTAALRQTIPTRIDGSLANIEQTTAQLHQTMQNLQQATQRVDAMVARGEAAVQNIEAAMNNAAALPGGPQAIQRGAGDLITQMNQPGNQGGAWGTVRRGAREWAGAIGEGVKEELIDPTIKRIEDSPAIKQTKEDLKMAALIGAGVIVGGIITYYTFRFIANKIERHLSRPRLEFSVAKAGAFDPEQHHALFRDMVFAQDIKDRLNTILLTTEAIKQRIQDGDEQAKYRNLLLYGPPGSGKRVFAQQLAQYANMDFYEVTSSALSRFKDGEAAQAVEDFLKNEAIKTTKGGVIYVDNANMLFTRRKAGDASSLTRLVTSFMEQLERRSNKYMVVFGSPMKPNLSADIMSVIDDTIEIKRPDVPERTKLLQLQREKLFTTPEVTPELAQSVQVHLNDEGINALAARLRGASAADICKFMETLKVEAQLPSQAVITPELMERIVERAVQKYQELIA